MAFKKTLRIKTSEACVRASRNLRRITSLEIT
jgi:hypothetical protein